MSDFWQDDENNNEEFRDIPDEVAGNGQEAPPARVRMQPSQQPQPAAPAAYSEPMQDEEQTPEEQEEDFSSVLTEARYKLELGRLYEMLMNHDIFQGAEADDKAIKYVTKQVRTFAKEQMEIMLGMRQAESKVQALAATDFPFNDLEVRTLKALAATATKGATAAPEVQQFTVSGGQAPVRATTGLRPITVKKAQSASAPAQRPQPAAPAPQKKPLQNAPAAPIKRMNPQIEQILAEEGVSLEEIDKTFDPNYKPLEKHPSTLPETEVIKRNKAASAGKMVKNPAAIPMPTAEQEEFHHSQRAAAAATNPQMMTIMNLLNNQVKKQ